MSKITVSREKLAWLFTGLGAVQAIIATIQFLTQRSLGLYWLGESHLSPAILGVAKIVSHGTTMIRGYGTFPHPNLLAAFLVTATLFNLYLLTKTYQKPRGIFLHVFLFLNVFGLFVTLSRGGILALGIGLLVICGYFLINKQVSRGTRIIAPALIAIAVSVAILAPYLWGRTTISDQATKERLFYNEIGISMIKDRFIAGIGPGTSVLHMKQYSETDLRPWEIQPIHNFYLISRAELGIGAISLLILIVLPIMALFKRKVDELGFTILALGISFLALFMLDHYFYTIWPTQLLLWLTVGLALQARSTLNNH